MKKEGLVEGRLEALSDGVFAIAMTLLVLDLRLPKFEGPVSQADFVAALRGQLPSFFAWLISFALLGRFWFIHHQLLTGVHVYPRRAVALNFVFLGVVSFIPFPTSVISSHFDQPLAMVLFAATYVVAAFALAGMWRALQGEHPSPEVRAQKDAVARWVVVWVPIAAAVACALSFLDTRLGLLALLAIMFLGRTSKRWHTT